MSPETAELAADRVVMALQELAPGTVAELCCTRGRPDDVGEEHGGEDAVRLDLPSSTCGHLGEELVEHTEHPLCVAQLRSKVAPVKLHEPRSRNVLGDV